MRAKSNKKWGEDNAAIESILRGIVKKLDEAIAIAETDCSYNPEDLKAIKLITIARGLYE